MIKRTVPFYVPWTLIITNYFAEVSCLKNAVKCGPVKAHAKETNFFNMDEYLLQQLIMIFSGWLLNSKVYALTALK